MPVSPMFQKSYKQISNEPFYKNGKLYVTMQHLNTGNKRDARWYTDSEYAKAYGKKLDENIDPNETAESMKKCRGFSDGPILVIRHNRPSDEEWLRASVARYAVGIGWYICSTDTFPKDAPAHLKYLLLSWDEFWNSSTNCPKKAGELVQILNEKAYSKLWINMKK